MKVGRHHYRRRSGVATRHRSAGAAGTALALAASQMNFIHSSVRIASLSFASKAGLQDTTREILEAARAEAAVDVRRTPCA